MTYSEHWSMVFKWAGNAANVPLMIRIENYLKQFTSKTLIGQMWTMASLFSHWDIAWRHFAVSKRGAGARRGWHVWEDVSQRLMSAKLEIQWILGKATGPQGTLGKLVFSFIFELLLDFVGIFFPFSKEIASFSFFSTKSPNIAPKIPKIPQKS